MTHYMVLVEENNTGTRTLYLGHDIAAYNKAVRLVKEINTTDKYSGCWMNARLVKEVRK